MSSGPMIKNHLYSSRNTISKANFHFHSKCESTGQIFTSCGLNVVNMSKCSEHLQKICEKAYRKSELSKCSFFRLNKKVCRQNQRGANGGQTLENANYG